jgi:hypothetical protein
LELLLLFDMAKARANHTILRDRSLEEKGVALEDGAVV